MHVRISRQGKRWVGWECGRRTAEEDGERVVEEL